MAWTVGTEWLAKLCVHGSAAGSDVLVCAERWGLAIRVRVEEVEQSFRISNPDKPREHRGMISEMFKPSGCAASLLTF